MSKNSAEPDELTLLLAASTGIDAEELKERAEEFQIEAPEDADWEYSEE